MKLDVNENQIIWKNEPIVTQWGRMEKSEPLLIKEGSSWYIGNLGRYTRDSIIFGYHKISNYMNHEDAKKWFKIMTVLDQKGPPQTPLSKQDRIFYSLRVEME